MKVLMVSRFWTCNHFFPGLKSDEFQRCSDLMVIGSFFPGEREKELRKRSAEIRGSLVEWKVKAGRPCCKNLRVAEEFTSFLSS